MRISWRISYPVHSFLDGSAEVVSPIDRRFFHLEGLRYVYFDRNFVNWMNNVAVFIVDINLTIPKWSRYAS